MCSELVQASVASTHVKVLSVPVDFNTIPPPDTPASLSNAVPLLEASSMVLSSTVRSTTFTVVISPVMVRFPSMRVLPRTSSLNPAVGTDAALPPDGRFMPTASRLESTNIADVPSANCNSTSAPPNKLLMVVPVDPVRPAAVLP